MIYARKLNILILLLSNLNYKIFDSLARANHGEELSELNDLVIELKKLSNELEEV